MDGQYGLAQELLNGGSTGLASECVAQDSEILNSQVSNVNLASRDSDGDQDEEQIGDSPYAAPSVTPIMESGPSSVCGTAPDGAYNPVETPTIRYDLDPIDEKNHRRVRKKIPYMQAVIAEIKVRFGTPTNTPANDRAIRRFASEIMRKHGVRHSEVRRLLPSVVSAAYIPDKWELRAARMLAAPGVSVLRTELSVLQSIAGFKGF